MTLLAVCVHDFAGTVFVTLPAVCVGDFAGSVCVDDCLGLCHPGCKCDKCAHWGGGQEV